MAAKYPLVLNGTAIQELQSADTLTGLTSGTAAQLLANDGSGGFSNVTVGSGLTFATGTLSASASSAFPAGTAMMFVQTTAPTGWTKSTTHDNKALRVVSGTASSGGSVAFTTAFANGSAGATTLSTAQMPSHIHDAIGAGVLGGATNGILVYTTNSTTVLRSDVIAATGGGGSHTHSLSLAVQYVDVIIATKD